MSPPISKKLFGTDGIRGKAGEFPITEDMAYKIGCACVHVLKDHSPVHIVIGQDTRESGTNLSQALARGAQEAGASVTLLGIIPTPGVCVHVRSQHVQAGIMVSASHNPYYDNGIKIFASDSFKLSDAQELEIERLIENPPKTKKTCHKENIETLEESGGAYQNFLTSTVSGLNLKGVKIVLDCAHGATFKIAPTIFKSLGAHVTPLGVTPNGRNINDCCGALHVGTLQKKVVEEKAHIGIAFDGDGDRVICIDEQGKIIDGADILAVSSLYLKKKNLLNKNTFVSTTMCNQGLIKSLQPLGINIVQTQVGDRYVLEKMRTAQYNLGGEPSGHIIFLDYLPTGDGILASLQLLKIMQEENKSLSKLTYFIEKFPQILKNIPVREKKDFSQIPHWEKAYEECKKNLGSWGRLIVRYSGTENLARVMAEGEDLKQVQDVVESLGSIIEKDMGRGS